MKTTPRTRLAGVAALALTLSALSACSRSDDTSSGDTGSAGNPGGGSSAVSGSAAADTGFKVNLDDCDDPDAATKQVTGSWKIGYSLPLSGPVAGVVTYATDGFKARIAAENLSRKAS